MASENALPCYARDSYNQILENAKPHDEPYERRISAFTYLRLAPTLMEDHPDGLGGNFYEFVRFVKRMHGMCTKTFVLFYFLLQYEIYMLC